MSMYETRQNKEKVSRSIDGNNKRNMKNSHLYIENMPKFIIQKLPIPIRMFAGRKQIKDENIAQRKFYFGSIILCDENTIKYELERNINRWFIDYARLAKMLYDKYNNEDIDMSIEILKQVIDDMWFFQRANNDTILTKLGQIDQENIKKEIKKVRINMDTRLSDETRREYINDHKNKTEIETLRDRWRQSNKEKADNELNKGKYIENEVYTEGIRGFMHNGQDFSHYNFRRNASKKGKMRYIKGVKQCYEHVLKEVLSIKDELVASWYFNAIDENEIFSAKELQSHSVRRKMDSNAYTKSMDIDTVNNKTGRYFYSFIEHKDSKYNTGTRFSQKATVDGQLNDGRVIDGSGRRLRIPLHKMVKAHAIIMGGDLVEDQQEVKKMKLTQNATRNKIFASGNVNPSNVNEYLEGLLKNYVNFVFYRLELVFNNQKDNDIVKQTITDLKNKKGQELWEYITRYVAQPQLMTPNKVSLGMKDIRLDSSPLTKE